MDLSKAKMGAGVRERRERPGMGKELVMSCKRVTGSWQTKIITVDKMLNSELWTRLSLRPPEVEPLGPVAAWELPGKEGQL